MKFLILSLFVALVACNKNNPVDVNTDPKASDTPDCCSPGGSGEDVVKTPMPGLMYSVDAELLDELGIHYIVTSRQAKAVQKWIYKCRPDFAGDAVLTDFAVETKDDGSKAYYRFFPILAKVEGEEGQIVKSNPENYNINLELVEEDPQAAPCDIPDDYELIGFVSTIDALTAEEVEKEVHGVGEVVPQCAESEEVLIAQPDDGSTYKYLESCENGQTVRHLNIYPGELYPTQDLFLRPTFQLEGTCETLLNKAESIKEMEESLEQISNVDHKKIISDIIADSKKGIQENYAQREGMVGTLIIDVNGLWDQVIENYRALNSDLDLEIKIAPDYYYSDPVLVYQSDNIGDVLEPYVREVPINIPSFLGLEYGAVSGQFSLSVADACIATDFTGSEDSLKERPLKVKISQ